MTARFFYTLWWSKIWVQRLVCADQHDWRWEACVCRRCGLTGEQLFDHSFAWRAPQYFVWRPWGYARG